MPVCLDICLMSERYEAGDGEDCLLYTSDAADEL